MVRINKIYTRVGDEGNTHLADGSQVRKDDPRIELVGALDELNACLGMARTLAHEGGKRQLHDQLTVLQNELFDLGAAIASPAVRAPVGIKSQVTRLEQWIDEITQKLPPLRSFVLPGGTQINAALHLARTVCRRAERRLIAHAEQVNVDPGIKAYINRVSDMLFAMARRESAESGRQEFLWKPGNADEAVY